MLRLGTPKSLTESQNQGENTVSQQFSATSDTWEMPVVTVQQTLAQESNRKALATSIVIGLIDRADLPA